MIVRTVKSTMKVIALAVILMNAATPLSAKELRRAIEMNLFENGALDELTVRSEILSYVEYLLGKDDFETLEIAADELRTRNLRTPSGTSKLSWFDKAIESGIWFEAENEVKREIVEKRIQAWIEKYPRSTSAHLAYARLQMQIAWNFRGNGYVQTVAPENWEPFRVHVEKARQYLEDYADVRNDDPRWDLLLMEIAKLQNVSDADYDALAFAAFARNPDYFDLYFEAMERHLPKWAGSLSHVEDFAQRAAAMTGEAEGQSLYARIYWAASQNQFNEKIFEHSSARWDIMREGFEDVLKKYPDTWNMYNFALFACYAGDDEKAAELMDRLSKLQLPTLFPDRENYANCRFRLGQI